MASTSIPYPRLSVQDQDIKNSIKTRRDAKIEESVTENRA